MGEKGYVGFDDMAVPVLRQAFVLKCVRWGREVGDPVGGEECRKSLVLLLLLEYKV